MVVTNQLEMVVVDPGGRKVLMVDVGIQSDRNVMKEEQEELEKPRELKEES